MKRLALVIGLIVLLISPIAHAEENWRIASFNSAIVIEKDGKVTITETIAADFGSEFKHGIFRDIPEIYTNQDGKTYTNISVIAIKQDSQEAVYSLTRDNGYLRIKIGDPNRTVTGVITYVITYSVVGVLRSFDSFDELYWNVTGTDWPVPIGTVNATVTLPSEKIIQVACYSGSSGSTDRCNENQTDRQAQFNGGPLLANQGLTLAVGYTKGLVPILQGVKPPVPYLWLSVILLVLGLILMPIYYLRRWYKHGRDEWYARKNLHDPNTTIKTMPFFAKETIVPEYAAPNQLRPAEIGVLVDERADTLDVSATIVDLAIRGHLTITEKPKKWVFGASDYTLTRVPNSKDQLHGYEQKLLSLLFQDGDSVDLSSLKNTFHASLKSVQDDLYAQVTDRKLFVENPQSVRATALTIPIIQLILAGVALGFSADSQNVWLIVALVSLLLSAILGIALSTKMPRRSAEGREALRKTLGYKLFLSQTEKYRQPFLENQNLFMDVLPYAMVFGVTKKLAESMEKIGAHPAQPSWYYGVTPWNPVLFTQNIGTVSAAMSTAMASTPGSSGSGGGGFSGGGFGGGGGGSW